MGYAASIRLLDLQWRSVGAMLGLVVRLGCMHRRIGVPAFFLVGLNIRLTAFDIIGAGVHISLEPLYGFQIVLVLALGQLLHLY